MKCIIMIFILLIPEITTYSQGINQFLSLSSTSRNVSTPLTHDTELTFKAGESPINPWIAGIQASYNFGIESKDFAERFSPNGKIVRIAYPYEAGENDRFRIYSSVNLADLRTASRIDISQKLLDLQESSEGLHILFTPLYFWSYPKEWQLCASVGIGYRLNVFKDNIDSNNVYLHQAFFTPFVEVISPYKIFKAPVTFSFGGSLKLIASQNDYNIIFGDDKTFVASFEITAIIPIYNNVGVVFHDTFSSNTKNQFKVGAIVSAGF